MVDVRQSHPAPHSQSGHPAAADHRTHDGGNGTGDHRRLEPVVVVGPGPGDIPVLVRNDADAVLLDPWMLTENDLPWLIFLCKKKYDLRFYSVTTEGWFRNIVLKSPLMFYPIRLVNSFMISMLSCNPWTPSEFECNVVFVCADDGAMWEAVKLLRASIEWARLRKCKRWRLSSDTDFDLAPMARRLGATEVAPRFTLEM